MNEIQDALVSNALNTAATLGELTLKNAKSKAKVRKVALKVFNMLKLVYAGDPDFEV